MKNQSKYGLNMVYVALGSNAGESLCNLDKACTLLQKISSSDLKKSSVYRTPPMGPPGQSEYLNQVVGITTDKCAESLLRYLKGCELVLGRRKRIRWGTREIDLDIVYFEKEVVRTSYLTIPHKGVVERQFVLRPLKEIAADFIDPVRGKSVEQLFQECISNQGEEPAELITNNINGA